MRTVADIGPATFVGAALLLAACLPARAESADASNRCMSIEDTDRRVECLEGTQESAETPPAPAPVAAPAAAPQQQSRGAIAPTFDCVKGSTPVQRTICGDATLAEWDSRVVQLFRQASVVQGKKGTLVADQRRWIIQRENKCKSTKIDEMKSCVLDMTKDRLTHLATVMASAGEHPTAAKTDPAGPAAGREFDCRNSKDAALCRDPKHRQARAGESAPEPAPKPTAESAEKRSKKSDRGRQPETKVARTAKEREDFRRILHDDVEEKQAAAQPAGKTEEPRRSPPEIDEDDKLEQANTQLGYSTISSESFWRDARDIAKSQRKISLVGTYLKIGDNERFFTSRMTAMLARGGQSTDPGIPLVTDGAPEQLRTYFLKCESFAVNVDIGCPAGIRGRVIFCKQGGGEDTPCVAVEGGAEVP
jgi:uncharacterized protein YecT (DUF1311 family)